MKKINYLRHLGLAVIAALGLLAFTATDANAQYGYGYPQNQGYGYGNYQQVNQIALTNGYQLGYGSGSNDRRYSASFDIDRNKTYRDADSGYRSEYGSKDNYRNLFRQGYELGYRDAYSGYQRRTFQGYNDYNYNNQPNYRNNRNYNNRGNNNRRYNRPYGQYNRRNNRGYDYRY